jgi:hypothetical protein
MVPYSECQVRSDRTGDYVYFASDSLVVLDTRTDRVVNRIDLRVGVNAIAKNEATNRLYLAGYSDTIQVVYDSVVLAGLQATPGIPTQTKRPQTLLNRSVPLRSPTDAILFDASGRRAAVLRSGPNDISHLAPGVYFIRGPKTEDGRPASTTVRKVVVTR